MPRLSEFYGIVVYMYWSDHQPPHFHAIYAGEEVRGVADVPDVGAIVRRARLAA